MTVARKRGKMIDLSLVGTLFSIQVTIGVVIFALVPLLEDVSLKRESHGQDLTVTLSQEMSTLSAFFVIATFVDLFYLGLGYSVNVWSALDVIFHDYGDASTAITITYDILPLVSLLLTFAMASVVVSIGFEIIGDRAKPTKGAREEPKDPGKDSEDALR